MGTLAWDKSNGTQTSNWDIYVEFSYHCCLVEMLVSKIVNKICEIFNVVLMLKAIWYRCCENFLSDSSNDFMFVKGKRMYITLFPSIFRHSQTIKRVLCGHDFWWNGKNWFSHINISCQYEAEIELPKLFKNVLRTWVIPFNIHVGIMYVSCWPLEILGPKIPWFSVFVKTWKWCSNLRDLKGKKSNRQV